MGYPKQRPRRPPRQPLPGTPGLKPQAPSERLGALRSTHAHLLSAIAAKKKSLDKLDAQIDEVARRMASLDPLRDRLLQTDTEVHRLFMALLEKRHQPRARRREIALIYDLLQRFGVLSPDDTRDEGEAEHDPRAGGEHERTARPGSRREAPVPSATRPGGAPEDQSLRTLFRRLAMAAHPDRVSDDAEKARRTEAMKEISRAYAERDLAHLLILERQWLTGAPAAEESVNEEERAYAHLDRINRDLRIQLENLTAELKARRRSPVGEMTNQLRHRPTRRGPDPIVELTDELEADLAQLHRLREILGAFVAGTLSFEAFLAALDPRRRSRER